MKRIIAIALIVSSSFSLADGNQPEPAPMSAEQKARGTNNISQHIGAGVLIALYFCDNDALPKSLGDLHEYGDKKKFPMPHPINWDRFAMPGSKAIFGDSIELKTPGGNEPGDIAVSSRHATPASCIGTIEPKMSLHLGDDPDE